jgi:serine phosphatase RsbU (regulator of sigma subunit)
MAKEVVLKGRNLRYSGEQSMKFKLPFRKRPAPIQRVPAPTDFPVFEGAELSAVYCGARMGGDFFDVLKSPSGRVVFAMLDIAGVRVDALNIASHVQDVFRKKVPSLFGSEDSNEAEAVTELAIELNRAIMDAAGGARCAPAFLGCYSPAIGTLTCVNAGHMPGFVVDDSDIILLASNGVPLGLFSHAIHEAQICALREGDAFVLASRGVAESHAKANDFGIEGIREALSKTERQSAHKVCDTVLELARKFAGNRVIENDMTALALLRAVPARRSMSTTSIA